MNDHDDDDGIVKKLALLNTDLIVKSVTLGSGEK